MKLLFDLFPEVVLAIIGRQFKFDFLVVSVFQVYDVLGLIIKKAGIKKYRLFSKF